jgi:uncharacterized protein
MDDIPKSCFPVIFDCHTHLYSPSIISSVSRREGLAPALGLNMEGALERTNRLALKRESAASGVRGCLLLPVAPASGVHEANRLFAAAAEDEESLYAAGTLHPAWPDIEEELEWLANAGIRAIKLSTFTQNFGLEEECTLQLFEKIRRWNVSGRAAFFVLLDTFYKADIYFGAPRDYVTTPKRLNFLAAAFPEITFIGAHMGGLSAPFQEIKEHLVPKDNLYLDTSNASQTLRRDDFLHLLHQHGPERILFGTDWPWFRHADEIPFIADLLRDAGFSREESSGIFGGNIVRLLGLDCRSLQSGGAGIIA